MIGLIFLLALFTWVILCVHLARKAPKWLNIKRYRFTVSSIVFLSLLVAPAVQDVVGMQQFNRLCKERAVVWVSPDAYKVKRAKDTSPAIIELPWTWIKIKAQQVEYTDIETNKTFYRYAILHTKGGLIGYFINLGNDQSCMPKNLDQTSHELDIDTLFNLK